MGPEWDLWYVPKLRTEAQRSERAKAEEPAPEAQKRPADQGRRVAAVVRPIDAPADQERPRSAPLRMLSPEEVEEVLTEVERENRTRDESSRESGGGVRRASSRVAPRGYKRRPQ